jgi:hypothetical protein
MAIRKTGLIRWLILSMSLPCTAADNTVPPPYMGQEPPGLTPKVFAPGLVSLPNRYEHGLCLSQDGRECYVVVRTADWSSSQILVMRYENGQWTSPVVAPFSNTQSFCPSLADNDQTLYFSRSVDIWRVRRTLTGSGTWSSWSQPEIVASPASSSSQDYSCHISTLGHLWTCSWRSGGVGGCDVWRVSFADGQFKEATDIRTVNASADDCQPVPGPNEDYIVFHSSRPGGFGGTDLYVSLANGQGGWTTPRNLGPIINTSKNDVVPYLSPDHKYLFFCREEASADQNVYWVRVEAFLPDPNGPVYNLSTGERYTSIQTAVNYAQSGQVILLSPGTYKENLILPNTTLTIRSANAQDSAVVSLTTSAGDGSSPVVTLKPGTALRSLQGLTITDGVDGISCPGAKLQLTSCVITGHLDSGIEVSEESILSLDHCIITGNAGPGLRSLPKTSGRGQVKYSKVDITQCCLVQNRGYSLEGDGITTVNSILHGNGISVGGVQIKGNNVQVSYSDVQGGFAGQGNIDADPLFVTAGTWTDPNTFTLGDYHLKSKAGHWNPRTCTWVLDDMTSLCIDAGDPNAAFSLEPAPNGDRLNLGAYGNTTEGSRTTVE